MTGQTPEPTRPSGQRREESRQGGIQIEARDVNVAGDVAGRDVIRTTNVGFSPQAVQRLIITVGVMVFVTAACFFSGGVVVGGVALAALDRPVGSSREAAASMQSKLEALHSLAPGTPFQLTFSEDEISSYFRFVAGPQIGVADGKVRLLDPGTLVVGGRVESLAGVPVAATFKVQDTPGRPLLLTGAALQLIQLRGTTFGWVVVPTAALQPLAGDVNHLLGNIRLTTVSDASHGEERGWTIEGVTR